VAVHRAASLNKLLHALLIIGCGGVVLRAEAGDRPKIGADVALETELISCLGGQKPMIAGSRHTVHLIVYRQGSRQPDPTQIMQKPGCMAGHSNDPGHRTTERLVRAGERSSAVHSCSCCISQAFLVLFCLQLDIAPCAPALKAFSNTGRKTSCTSRRPAWAGAAFRPDSPIESIST
jgi:hypothetical protein